MVRKPGGMSMEADMDMRYGLLQRMQLTQEQLDQLDRAAFEGLPDDERIGYLEQRNDRALNLLMNRVRGEYNVGDKVTIEGLMETMADILPKEKKLTLEDDLAYLEDMLDQLCARGEMVRHDQGDKTWYIVKP